MYCTNTDECFEQVSAYFDGDKTSHFLLVNTENYDVYQEILQRLQADSSKKCVYVSKNLYPNGLPDVDSAISKIVGEGKHVLVGLSQALMMQEVTVLEKKIDEVLERSIRGYGVVLLEHCEQVLQKYIRRDIRVQHRVILAEGESSMLPQIKLAKKEVLSTGIEVLCNFGCLLDYLEKLTDTEREQYPSITVVSPFSIDMFRCSVYSIMEMDGIYEMLINKYSDIAGSTEKSYGNDIQWKWLMTEMKSHTSFSSLICDIFGATVNLSTHISAVMESGDKNRKWLLWLSMKIFGEINNKYLTIVLNHSNKFETFEEHIYLDFVDVEISHPNFEQYYIERKYLIGQMPENLSLVSIFCEKLGRHQKNMIFYLTDSSDEEKFVFVRCLSIYDYTNKEIEHAILNMSKDLSLYIKDFIFDSTNTRLSESDNTFREKLTDYFRAYKMQKLTNRIWPEFLETVNQYAISRPYNKLQPRSSIISHMNKKDMQLFFFDALGVEYLAFILAKCEEYGLTSEVFIAHCELPSITSKNKEFLQYFTNDRCYKINDLDEIKHHSPIYNYQKCKYPRHLFEELDIIDKELRKIQAMFVRENLKKALIVSDHGASRLAVLYGHEVTSMIELDEFGEHSGRCCPINKDPRLPFAAYEDDFSVLANYERFRGGRKANVEVHGGASLEEVLVPVIVLAKRPDNIEICFTNPIITLKPRIIPELILYFNIPFQQPRLYIDGEFFDGEFTSDKRHARFSLPRIKRKGDYSAEVYDGNKKMSITLEFKAQKQTREVENWF